MSDEARVDLSALRQARHEANGVRRVFVLDDHEYEGPSELPLAFAEYLLQGNVRAASRCLFGIEGGDLFMNSGATVNDLIAIERAYGMSTAGEVFASPGT